MRYKLSYKLSYKPCYEPSYEWSFRLVNWAVNQGLERAVNWTYCPPGPPYRRQEEECTLPLHVLLGPLCISVKETLMYTSPFHNKKIRYTGWHFYTSLSPPPPLPPPPPPPCHCVKNSCLFYLAVLIKSLELWCSLLIQLISWFGETQIFTHTCISTSRKKLSEWKQVHVGVEDHGTLKKLDGNDTATLYCTAKTNRLF